MLRKKYGNKELYNLRSNSIEVEALDLVGKRTGKCALRSDVQV